MLLALITAAAAANPQPTQVMTFQDWTVACDNGLGCEAVALLPEADWEGTTTLLLRRGAGANDAPILLLDNLEQQPTALLVDGRALPVRFASEEAGYRLQGDPAALIDALRQGSALEARGAAGASLGRVSLAGASAALLYMDEQQRRIGTVTALVRPGPRPASAVPPPPALPQVRLAPAPTDRALTIDAARVAQLRRRLNCDEYDVRENTEFEVEHIATGRTLVLIPCGSGAYNFSSVPVIAQRRGGRVDLAVALFDSQWGIATEGRPTLVNASWDPEARRLREYSKGRGLGDCGTSSEYVWDGERFRLVGQQDMAECRGALTWLTTWRAEAIGR